jgi:hypothetical protein
VEGVGPPARRAAVADILVAAVSENALDLFDGPVEGKWGVRAFFVLDKLN